MPSRRLDLDLDASVIVDTLTRFWLVWSGSSEGFGEYLTCDLAYIMIGGKI